MNGSRQEHVKPKMLALCREVVDAASPQLKELDSGWMSAEALHAKMEE